MAGPDIAVKWSFSLFKAHKAHGPQPTDKVNTLIERVTDVLVGAVANGSSVIDACATEC